MTLDEAIEHHERNAMQLDSTVWQDIADDSRQLADWLTDLRMHRESEPKEKVVARIMLDGEHMDQIKQELEDEDENQRLRQENMVLRAGIQELCGQQPRKCGKTPVVFQLYEYAMDLEERNEWLVKQLETYVEACAKLVRPTAKGGRGEASMLSRLCDRLRELSDGQATYRDAREVMLEAAEAILELCDNCVGLREENDKLRELLQRTWDAFHDATAREFIIVKNELRELGIEVGR